MRTYRLRRCLFLALLGAGFFLFAALCKGQWVAFNDHVPGPSTHSNATTLKIPANGGPISTNMLLKNIANGTNLNVLLTITRSTNGVIYDSSGGLPAAGTPLYNTFTGLVYFGSAVDCNVGLSNLLGGTVTYTFSGLNPSNRYSFKGGAIRGNSTQTNRWTRIELQGALSFQDAHSAQVFTASQIPDLASNQVAVSFGRNNTPTTGDMVDWEQISPGSNGIISIICSHFTNAVPTGTSSGITGYAVTGMRLEEFPQGPPTIIVPPTNQAVYSGEIATFSAQGIGTPPLTYQWYRNDMLIDGATSTNYTIGPTTAADDGAMFRIVITNMFGAATSSVAVLTVSNGAPILLSQPQSQTVNVPVTANFSVVATGSKPLSYQWYRNHSMIGDATNASYTTPATSINDSGARFSVIVFNSIGSTTSSNATLLVNAPPLLLIPYTNVWKYLQDTNDPGTAWRGIAYNDSGWPQGPGWLGVETDAAGVIPMINTTLSLSEPGGTRIHTYYFRTHFTVNFDPAAVLLVSSNYIDDGAVFYLNGQEYGRFNMDTNAVINYRSSALSAAAEGTNNIFTNILSSDLLVPGDNVLAVEVHQINDTSSDIDFGYGLSALSLPPSALAITNNPADRIVSESAATSFTVGFTGGPPSFQWYRWINGSPAAILNATKKSYTITNVALADAGYYFVVISNNINAVASSAARLVVTLDQSAPKLVSADGSASATQIVLSFSEPVLASTATNIANYRLTNVTSGGTLAITAAILQGGTNVILGTAGPRSFADNWLLIVSNVRDISPQQNPIAFPTAIPVSTRLTLIGFTDPGWDFYDPVGPPIDSYEPPTDWNEINFQVPADDWGRDAAGLFAYNPNQQSLPAPVNTALSGGAISSYFRFPLDVSFSPVGATLLLRQIIDDGIVTYLNGAEIYRFNMPPGGVNALTPATQSRTAFDTGSLPLPALFLNAGSNVLAAELHGSSTSDNDLAFGAELDAQILSWARGPVLITSGPDDVTILEGGSAVFRFLGVGASGVQWRTNLVAIPGANRPILQFNAVPLSWDGLFVQVVASNSTSRVVSTNARLHVLADITPPSLLRATIGSNTVFLSFSEALLASSATNLANFQARNSDGASLSIVSASLINPSNVVLFLSSPPATEIRVILNGLRDLAANPNEIAPNTIAMPGFDLFVPIDAFWKYDQSGSLPSPSWNALAYDDGAWPEGAALLYNESAALPAPKNTPLNLSDTNGAQINTYYFRRHFPGYGASASLSATFRHVVDDGVILYLNGAEIHRFNMPAGPVSNSTLANTNVGDAIFVGPFQITLTNLNAGDNVIAAEVHQNPPSANSDVTFGLEFSAHVNAVVSPGIAPTTMRILRQDGNIVVSWPGSGFILESSDALGSGANWQPVDNHINPYFAAPSAATQRFYRLRR